MSPQLQRLAARLGYTFKNEDLLEQALTHPSVVHGRAKRQSTPYERLEFLGDRVLGLVVADMLFLAFPNEAEGALARRHAALVKRETLVRVAVQIGLPEALVMSKGEEDGGGRANPSMLADACEAVLGAMFADDGFDEPARFIRSMWDPLMHENQAPPKDAKTSLQEWAQGLGKPLPHYSVVGQDGPSHDPVFLVRVEVTNMTPVEARGSSKRAAEQAAAEAMLAAVHKEKR